MTDSMVGGWTSHFNYPSWTVCRFCDLFAEQRESCHNLFYFFFFFYKWQLLFYKDTPHLNLASHVIQHFNAKTMSGFYCGSDFNYFFFFGVDVFSCMKMYGLTFKGKV